MKRIAVFMALVGWVALAPVLAADDPSAAASQSAPSPSSGLPDTSGAGSEATGDWGGLRSRLEKAGFSFGLAWVGEGFWNTRGGVETGAVSASTTDLNLTVDTEKALDWAGGKFYADLEDHAGSNPSSVLTGDLESFDKLNYTPYLQMFELYFEQKLFSDRLRLKVGKIDGNSEFSVIDNGLSFIDASTQVTPTLLGFTTTPDPMPTVDVFYTPADFFYTAFSAALANKDDRFLDVTGDPWAIQPTRNGALLIEESGFDWKRALFLPYDGNFKFGFWSHTGTFARFDGGLQDGARGFYAILDQTLWKPSNQDDDPRGLRTFLEYGHTDADVSAICEHIGGGMSWKGPLPRRPNDEIGLAVESVTLSSQARLSYSHEGIVETFYKAQLFPWATLQPDVQFISHPGGVYPTALLGMLQLSVQF